MGTRNKHATQAWATYNPVIVVEWEPMDSSYYLSSTPALSDILSAYERGANVSISFEPGSEYLTYFEDGILPVEYQRRYFLESISDDNNTCYFVHDTPTTSYYLTLTNNEWKTESRNKVYKYSQLGDKPFEVYHRYYDTPDYPYDEIYDLGLGFSLFELSCPNTNCNELLFSNIWSEDRYYGFQMLISPWSGTIKTRLGSGDSEDTFEWDASWNEFHKQGMAPILTSSDGKQFKLSVSPLGELTTTQI